jgi:hypothetical protein
MASAEVVSQSRMDNANSVVKDLNPFTKKNGTDIASDKQGTFVAVCSKYSLTVNTVYLYNKGD